jgi:arylsulfatase A-like enzyme
MEKKNNSKITGSVNQLYDFIYKKDGYSEDELRTLIQLYDSEVIFVDDNMGYLFNNFFKASRNFIYIITADHGEALGEDGQFLHAEDLIEPMVKVPLILKCSWFPFAGKKVDEIVSSIDILPTVLDLLSKSDNSYQFDGKSLVPLMEGKPQSSKAFAYFETAGVEKIGLRYREYKMIYDVVNKEKKILKFSSQSKMTEINMEYKKEISVSRELESIILDLLGTSSLDDIKIVTSEIDERLEKQLKALGYIK